MNKKIENAIIINGKVYELVEDLGADECERCALGKCCTTDQVFFLRHRF